MKINTETIPGYSEMSAEEKLKALEEFEFDDHSDELEKLKSAMSKANSENAAKKREIEEWKDKWKAGLDEAKRAQVEREEHDKAVEDELRTLRRDKTVSGYQAQCLALGYTQELALRAAEAMADNDAAAIMACQQEFLDAKQKELEAAALNKQPTQTTGSPPTAQGADLEALNKQRRYFGLPPIKQ